MDEQGRLSENGGSGEEKKYGGNNGGLSEDSEGPQAKAVRIVYVKTLTGKTVEVEVKASAKSFCDRCTGPCRSTIQYRDLVCELQWKYKWDIFFTINLVQEFTRFLELKCCMKDWGCKKIFPSPLIDLVWEECLEDVDDYEKMCKEIHKSCKAAGPFHSIHRIPKNMGHLSSTRFAYEARFSTPPEGAYWSDDAEAPPTCGCLANAVFEKERIPVNQVRLIYAGKQLENNQLLTEYGIRHQSTVKLVLRQTGC